MILCVWLQVSGGVSKSSVPPVRRRVLHGDGEELGSVVYRPHLVAGATREERNLRPVISHSNHDWTHAV